MGNALSLCVNEPADIPPLRVLVVDDDEDGRELLAIYLRVRGLEVETAHDCCCAKERVKQWGPNVAVVDMTLPDGDGCELGALMREMGSVPLRLVALSGHTGSSYRERTTAAGFDAYLVKPIEPSAIFRVVSGGVR